MSTESIWKSEESPHSTATAGPRKLAENQGVAPSAGHAPEGRARGPDWRAAGINSTDAAIGTQPASAARAVMAAATSAAPQTAKQQVLAFYPKAVAIKSKADGSWAVYAGGVAKVAAADTKVLGEGGSVPRAWEDAAARCHREAKNRNQ